MDRVTSGLSLRVAGEADVAAVVALVESAYRGESSRAGWTSEAHLLDGQRTDPDAVRALVAGPGSEILLGESGKDTVASCALERHDATTSYFGMFAVRPGLQGAGVGGWLLEGAERRAARQHGTRRMRLTVIAQREDLIAWYERRAYRRTGERLPFPYGDERFGIPRRDDLEFVVLEKALELTGWPDPL